MRTATSPLPARLGELRPAAAVTAGCVVLAALSLVLPSAIGYDPWAWLVWGREVVRLDLDTTGGPSWKPLPVLVDAVLSIAGRAAPALWLVVARTASLLLVVTVARLAARIAGLAAGALDAALLVLTPDPDPRFIRLTAEGHTAPLEALLALWAVERHVAGRRSAAMGAGFALALLRPEAWPFLGLYGLWAWRERWMRRDALVAAAALLALLWFGADWWGSGSPWHGAEAAQVATGDGSARLEASLERVAELVPLPVWVAAAAGAVSAWRRREHLLVLLTVGAAGWAALVVVMAAVLRYAALSRFLMPVAVVLCLLAGVGVVRVGSWVRARARPPVAVLAAAVVVALGAALVWPRVEGIKDVAEEVRDRGRLQDDFFRTARDLGADTLLACGPVSVDPSSLLGPAVAWELDVPLERIITSISRSPLFALTISGGPEDRAFREAGLAEIHQVTRTRWWTMYARACL